MALSSQASIILAPGLGLAQATPDLPPRDEPRARLATQDENYRSREQHLVKLRMLFFAGIEDAAAADTGLEESRQLTNVGEPPSQYLGYFAAFLALQAKHSIFPLRKLRLTKESLATLDRVHAEAPHDLETRILRTSVLIALPSFFGRHEDGLAELATLERDFSSIQRSFPCNVIQLAANLIKDHLPSSASSLTALERSAIYDAATTCPMPSSS